MSQNRQYSDPPTLRSIALRLTSGARLDSHSHDWGQFIYAVRGALAIEAVAQRWVVPPQRGVWVPEGVTHLVESIGETWMRTIYIPPTIAEPFGDECRVLGVSALLRETISEVTRLGILDQRRSLDAGLMAVLLATLEIAPSVDASLTLPTDPRAEQVARRVIENPSCADALDGLSQGTGACPRTIDRIFVRETGVSFGRWRQQARLQHALRLLAEGVSVTNVALDCGYSSPSAFIAMFRRAAGITPGRYIRGEEPDQAGGARPNSHIASQPASRSTRAG